MKEDEEAESHPAPLDPLVSSLANSINNLSTKGKRRGSISVSRVGTVSFAALDVKNLV